MLYPKEDKENRILLYAVSAGGRGDGVPPERSPVLGVAPTYSTCPLPLSTPPSCFGLLFYPLGEP